MLLSVTGSFIISQVDTQSLNLTARIIITLIIDQIRLDFSQKCLILSINKSYRVAAHVEHPKSFTSEVYFGEDVVYVGCRLLPRCLSSSFAVFVRLCVSTCGADVWTDGNSRKLMSRSHVDVLLLASTLRLIHTAHRVRQPHHP